MISGGFLAMATPAANATTPAFVNPVTTAVVDSAMPHKSAVDPASLPIGTTVDTSGTTHTTKAYLTFDLSQLVGHELLSAELELPETAVADCSVDTTPQAWLTDTAQHPTFDNQPAERTELTGPGRIFGCPDDFPLEWDAKAALQTALAAGQHKATIEIRLADADATDPAHALTFDPKANLLFTYNVLPSKPTNLVLNNKACTTTKQIVGLGDLDFAASVTDPDDAIVKAEFDYWPVNDPTDRTAITEQGASGIPSRVTLPQSSFADNTTYAWQVRGVDVNQPGTVTQLDGPFSKICRFETDFTAPKTAPTVTSPDFPSGQQGGGAGLPGTFTFSGNGDRDVTGFSISPDFETVIPANKPGGTATFQFTPTRTGPNSITVFPRDKAGNVGPSTTYDFFVKSDSPTVTCDPPQSFIGQPLQCTFSSPIPVNGYQYQLQQSNGSGPLTTVPTGADGTATITIVPSDPVGFDELHVQGELPNGNLSADAGDFLSVDPGVPTIDQSDFEPTFGSPVTFTFHAALPDSVSFTYTFGSNPPVTVPVGADGTATVVLRPDEPQFEELDVFSSTASGVNSGVGSAFLSVDSNGPTVTSPDYPDGQFGGGTGDPGTFTFSSAVPDAVSYTYSFDNAAPVTVAAGADGTASVTLVPTRSGQMVPLDVATNFADGSTSEQTEYEVFAHATIPTVECDTVDGEIQPGTANCVFTAVQQNASAFVYTIDDGSQQQTVQAADGTAQVSVDTGTDTVLTFTVQSENAEGDLSDSIRISFAVGVATPQVRVGSASMT